VFLSIQQGNEDDWLRYLGWTFIFPLAWSRCAVIFVVTLRRPLRGGICVTTDSYTRDALSNPKFEWQLRICSGTDKPHERTWPSRPVAGASGCMLTSSQ
jgi:hypothetical protein